ncbi:sulfite exporter TauE/SafE family protein [Croceicoccus mobilis]|uniref:Probable membrane transporter protein n=1 Tax=Croceicoccus mobilis TaxID=1703339 RepID=A0A917DYJ0_9SPHN|nr:sulfite exporter TauE/SafE family protein [Croceicoccus mobilis]GGD83766.1 UPF0721 transmembrane protein [Croceicoccus mobilis]
MIDQIIEWAPIIGLMLGAGVLAGFAAGLFGIGGGFVVVPALFVMLPLLGGSEAELAHVAIGTSLATIVVTSLRSMQAHARRGAVDFVLLKQWAPYIVVGSIAGVLFASLVSSSVLAIIFGVGVILMAIHFLYPILKSMKLGEDIPAGGGRMAIATGLGASSSLLGIGGGTVAIIVMTLYGRSIHRAIGTASGIGVIIAVPSAIGYAIIGLGVHGLPVGSLGYVNVIAALSIVAMSSFSAPWGAAAAHHLNPEWMKRIFGVYLLFIGAIMIRNGLTA